MLNTSAHLASPARLLDALAHARSVAVTSYVLRPDGDLVRELVAAASRGARVDVSLAGDSYAQKNVGSDNDASAKLIRAAGGRVFYDRQFKGQSPLHMKSIVADGSAFLDDRNWTFGDDETILEDRDPKDVALVRRSQFFAPQQNAVLTTDKGAALEREAQAVRAGRGHRIDVETESFSGGKVAQALRDRALRGERVRLLVLEGDVSKPRARNALTQLERAGVEVRGLGARDPAAGAEKMALAGDRAWIGSANATSWPANTVDWGLVTTDAAIAAHLRRHFERDWAAASPLVLAGK